MEELGPCRVLHEGKKRSLGRADVKRWPILNERWM